MNFDVRKLVLALKARREAEGLSLRALSSKIGVSFSTLARIERGDGEPDNNSAIRILEWLGQDARDAGLALERVAYVHFRANKNVQSQTVHCLLDCAAIIKLMDNAQPNFETPADDPISLTLTKDEMEERAEQFRADLGLKEGDTLDSLRVRVDGVSVYVPKDLEGLSTQCLSHIRGAGSDQWSAMSVPLDIATERWAILRNDQHTIERQRVTYLEECWHILLGHKLTKIAKISDAYGRTFDSTEEHDAFYLATASLLPKSALTECVRNSESAESIAKRFGVSPQLVEYRIKRLGLWSIHRNRAVQLG
jgi:transcriptional regulator with XRE-family HTH domain